MKFLPLDKDGASLEFSLEEWATVEERLRRFGSIRKSPRVGQTQLMVGAVTLMFMDEEWDGPALLATDEAGVSLLENVAADSRLGAPARGRIKAGSRTGSAKRDHLTA